MRVRFAVHLMVCSLLASPRVPAAPGPEKDADVDRLGREVAALGWIVYSASVPSGSWDLFVMRPDGSERRALTETPRHNEAGARFSPDGRKLLYYRMASSEPVDNNTYGTHELIVADADGGRAVSLGKDFPWASWGPGSNQVTSLGPAGIRVVDLETKAVVRQVPRRGLVQQLIVSPDGQRLAGTANGLGPYWNIGWTDWDPLRLAAASETDRYNCTPDWSPDSRQIVYSRGIIPEVGGFAEIWASQAAKGTPKLLVAEPGRHLYGACVSPDGNYLLFTRSESDLGRVDNSQTSMAIVRMADTPISGSDKDELQERRAGGRSKPRLDLGPGWEPHWTARSELTSSSTPSR